MNSTAFTTATAGSPLPDPRKHVNYTQGMVLGVDDFTQEFAYLSNRDHWLARDAIGYGTLCGLRVTLEPKGDDTEVSVTPGVALDPRGQLIKVPLRQCARIGAWLQLEATRKKLAELSLSPPGPLTAYVVLCYRDCPTDKLPVPGEPCRCDSEIMAASRIVDDFRLELRLTPPAQREEDAVRDFVAQLRTIPIADFEPAPGDLETFLDALRSIITSVDSPPQAVPDLSVGSPAAALRIPRREVSEWLRAAMRLWVTELRPRVQSSAQGGCGCGDQDGGDRPADGDCLLLAEIGIEGESPLSVRIDESRRPVAVHLRMLEELMLYLPSGGAGGLGRPNLFGGLDLLDFRDLANAEEFIGKKGPTGDKGPTGNKGSTGDKGAVGDKGPAGDQGPGGDKGPPGDKGAAGNKGAAGDKGPVGDKGAVGDKGPAGDAGAVPTDIFVDHPKGLPRYSIVAAGLVGFKPTTNSDPTRKPRSYNDLTVTKAAANEIEFNFKGYKIPAGEHQYVVKVLPVTPPDSKGVVAMFGGYLPDGIKLTVTNLGGAALPNLQSVEFMIEVSQFLAPA